MISAGIAGFIFLIVFNFLAIGVGYQFDKFKITIFFLILFDILAIKAGFILL